MRSPHRPFAARTQNPRKKIIKEFENHPSRLLQIAEEDERVPGISLRLATLAEHWICVSFFDIELLDSMEGAKSVGSVAEAATTAEKRSRFRRICVFCGSQCGKKPSYQEAAIELGKELVNSGIDLVYGGGSIGLMGLVSHAVHDGGRHVLGVIPKSLMLKELTGGPVGEVREVSDMHERKAEMARQADAFIALPGGYGTLEELLEVITWAQLGIHKKPVGLLNVDGFYNSLLSFIDMAVEEGFISQAARHIIISAHSAEELMRKLEECIPEYESKLVWDTTEQKPLSFVPEPESGIAS